MHDFSDAWSSHTSKSQLQKIGHHFFPESEKLKSDQCYSTLLKLFTRVEPVEVV